MPDIFDQLVDTPLSAQEEQSFQKWKQEYAPKDSGDDYDLRGAFKAGLTPAANGHWPDTYKKPNHPTFSNESIYAKDYPDLAGHWVGETYVPPQHAGDIFDELATKPKGDVFDQIGDLPAANFSPLNEVPQSGEELGAKNFQDKQSLDAEMTHLPRGLPSLHSNDHSALDNWWENFKQNTTVGRNMFGDPSAFAGDDLEQKGALPTLLGLPARVATDQGRAAKAGLADLAAAMKGDNSTEGDFGGNLKELSAGRGQTQLPIERAMQLSADDDKQRHVLGWQTISADISLGLADMAPKIAMLEAAPGGMLPKSGAAADIFGFDDNGKFSPKSAAFAAAFPFVTEAAATATDAAIKKAVERGFDWAGTSGAQRALHVAANQSAMNAVMIAQSSPELVQLAGSDPDEFKRQLAKIMASNLAFAIPEAMKDFQPVSSGTENAAPAPEAKPAAVSPDLAAELQAAMTGNQVKAVETPPPSAQPAGENAPPEAESNVKISEALNKNRVQQALEELRQAPKTTEEVKPATALTAEPEAASTSPGAAAETITGQNERPGSEATTATTSAVEPMPAEGETLPQKPRPASGRNPFFLRSRSDGVPDILDSIQELGGIKPPGEYSGGEYDGYREAMTGPARMLINKNSKHGPDTIIAELQSISAPGANRIESADDLWSAVSAAVKGRDALKVTERGQREEGKQVSEFQRRVVQGDRPKKEVGKFARVPVRAMLEGDRFEAQGFKFEVKHLEFDDAGNLVSVEVKDGPKFGVQRVDGDEFIHIDKGSYLPGAEHDGHVAPELEKANPQVPDNSKLGGKTGGEPLKLHEKLEAIAPGLYGRSYDELPADQKGHVDVTHDAQGNISGREQPGDTGERGVSDTGKPPGEGASPAGPASELQPGGATTGRRRASTTKIKSLRPGDLITHNGVEVVVESWTLDPGQKNKGQLRVSIPGHPEKWAAVTLDGRQPISELQKPYAEHEQWQRKSIEDWLDSLKSDTKGTMQAFGLLPEAWNTLIDLVKLGVRGGRELKNAIEWAINQFTLKHPGEKFDEDGAREYFANTPVEQIQHEEPTGSTRTVEPRDFKTVQTELDQAADQLREAIGKNDPKKAGGLRKAEVRQEQAVAAARYRTLKDELINNDHYVADLLTRHETAVKAGAPEAEDLRAKLEEIPPKLLNRVHDDLQKRGVLSKPPAPPATGRSLDNLTDWLQKAGVDSPKRSLRERLALGQRVADRWNALKDAAEHARLKLGLAWKTAIESIKHPPIDTGFRNVMKDWKFMDEWTGQQTARWVREINKEIENPLRQQALSVWLDANGDESILRYQAAAVPERYAAVWREALKLTPKEKELGLRIKRDFEDKLNDGQNAGLIEKGREDYGVPQVWKKAPEVDPAVEAEGRKGSPGNPYSKLDPRDPFFSFQRSHVTYFDGIMAGGVPESLRIGDLVAHYNNAFHKALTSRGAIWSLKNELAADNRPIVKISGSARQVTGAEAGTGTYFVDSKTRSASDVAEDGRPYRPIDHFAMRDWKVAYKTSDGKTVLVRGDMLIHPDHYEFLKNELGQSAFREGAVGRLFKPVLNSGAFLKASKLALGTFHAATVAEHALSHWINPYTGNFEIDLRKPDQALLVRNGLELGMSGPQAMFEEGLASHGGLFEKVPGLGDLSRKFSDWLFKDYIPALSMKAGLEVLKRNRDRYSDKLSESQIAELTAHQMNAAFGLQNYRLLGRNKTILDIERMLLLAPQFLEARAKVVGQALKPYGAEQRRMLFVQAATLYVGARILNAMLDDDPHWEEANAFSVVYHGRAYALRTMVGDLWHLINDPKSFAAGRLSPWVRLGIETLTQRDMRTGARKEPPIQTEWMPGRVAQNFVVDLAKWLLPVGSEGVMPGAAAQEQGPVSSALASVGVGSRKFTAQTQVFGWATDFNRNSPDPAARTFQRQQDAEVHGESAYRQLDALLDASRLDQARTEYGELLKDGHKAQNISMRYKRVNRPFTGTLARESDFKAALDPKQQAIYDRAIEERKKRYDGFQQMLQQAGSN